MWETWVLSLGWEDLLEKGITTHSSILAWRIPWIVESIELQRVATEQLSLSLEKGMAIHSSILAWRTPCTEKPSGL